MNECSFPTIKEVLNTKFQVNQAAITDFAILLGGDAKICRNTTRYNSQNKKIETRKSWIGKWWTKSSDDSYNTLKIIDEQGNIALPNNSMDPRIGFCPVINLQAAPLNRLSEINYGKYPQTAVKGRLADKLEKAYNEKKLNQTGKIYTTNDYKFDIDFYGFHYERGECLDYEFIPKSNIEYEYKGEKYIRITSSWKPNTVLFLSDKRLRMAQDACWVKVEPITWIVNQKDGLAISKDILLAGIPYCDISNFLSKYFYKEAFFNNDYELTNSNYDNSTVLEKSTCLKERTNQEKGKCKTLKR